jgi:hypothetical protein
VSPDFRFCCVEKNSFHPFPMPYWLYQCRGNMSSVTGISIVEGRVLSQAMSSSRPSPTLVLVTAPSSNLVARVPSLGGGVGTNAFQLPSP